MSEAKLMLPLFYNGRFNRNGHRIRAVHNHDVSDGGIAIAFGQKQERQI